MRNIRLHISTDKTVEPKPDIKQLMAKSAEALNLLTVECEGGSYPASEKHL